MPSIKHSSASNEHYTPPAIAQASRATMGGIALDPASCPLAQSIIRANRFFTQAEDGFRQHWHAPTLLLNPPGGTNKDRTLIHQYGTDSSIAQWFRRLLDAYKSGDVGQAVFVGFQLSVLRICQEAIQYPFVIPQQRIAFWTTPEDLEQRERKKKKPRLDAVQNHLAHCLRKEGQHVTSEYGVVIPSQHPSHDNVLIYLPDRGDIAGSVQRFRQAFSTFGTVKGECALS